MLNLNPKQKNVHMNDLISILIKKGIPTLNSKNQLLEPESGKVL